MEINRYGAAGTSNKKLIGRYTLEDEKVGRNTGEKPEELPVHGSYGHLLFDPRWKAKRNEIMARDNGCCVICKSSDELQVHHRQYQFVKSANGFKVPWDYPNELLITLCTSCHQRGHSKFKVPILII